MLTSKVRHKLKNFLDEKEGVAGFLDFEYFKTLVEYDKTRWPSKEFPHKMLTAKGDEVIKKYTQVWALNFFILTFLGKQLVLHKN